MNFSVVHVICDDVIFLPNPNKEKQIPFWVNRWVVLINVIEVTKFNVSLHKHVQSANSMLQCPFISTIVFKDPDWKFGHIVTMNSTYTQVTLSLMDGGWRTTRARNFPPCLSLHIHNKYQRGKPRVPHNVQTTVNIHSFWWSHFFKSLNCHTSIRYPFRFLTDPCYSFRWVDVHIPAPIKLLLFNIFNHMEVRGGFLIEPQSSLTNRMDVRWHFLELLGCWIGDDIAVWSISPSTLA